MSQLSLLVDNPDAARKSRQLVVFASSLGTFTKGTLSCQLLCRFSDAGNDDLTTRCGGRRPKSAKARNRVGR
jgi:hypothetical protein